MKIVIYGASGQGRVTADLLRQTRKHTVIGFVDDEPAKKGSRLDGLPVFGSFEEWTRLRISRSVKGVTLAIGDGEMRSKVAQRVTQRGFQLVGFVHPRAVVSSRASIEPTAMVWPQAVINAGARVGLSSIVNTAAVVEHDVEVGAFVHLAPNSTLCGNVIIGDYSWVGAGAVVIQGIKVGEKVMIGAGAVVVRDVPPSVVGSGVPFRIHSRK